MIKIGSNQKITKESLNFEDLRLNFLWKDLCGRSSRRSSRWSHRNPGEIHAEDLEVWILFGKDSLPKTLYQKTLRPDCSVFRTSEHTFLIETFYSELWQFSRQFLWLNASSTRRRRCRFESATSDRKSKAEVRRPGRVQWPMTVDTSLYCLRFGSLELYGASLRYA